MGGHADPLRSNPDEVLRSWADASSVGPLRRLPSYRSLTSSMLLPSGSKRSTE